MDTPARGSPLGTWEQKSATFWIYHLQGEGLIYGYAVRRQPDATATWDAMVASPAGKEDVPIRRGITLDEAKDAVERDAAGHR